MRKFNLFFAILFCNFLHAQTKITTYEQLASVNDQWKYQTNVSKQLKNTQAEPLAEHQLQQLHLQETEKLLRSRNVSNLSNSLKKQRAKNLNILHSYWNRGLFPINDMHEGRQPYFIDKNNTYCAVGYLMQHTSADNIAKDVKATQNYSYLKDITHPKLMNWVAHSGLNIDELALIQLPYFGPGPCLVTEMHYNNAGADVSEYIEIRQTFIGAGGGAGLYYFDKVLFYDQTNTLYKTLDISQMQTVGSGGQGGLYYYTFPTNENFADEGYIEMVNSIPTDKVLAKIVYNQSTVTYYKLEGDLYLNPPTYENHIFNVGENESTMVGSTLSFCGSFGNFQAWTLQSTASSTGVINSCLIVPITLSKFDYFLKDNTVILQWQTENEVNSSHFEIERSADGVNFERIGKILAAGNNTTSKQYKFVDDNPKYINQYRLKQVDLDGTSTYSKILYVKVTEANAIKIIENPVINNLKLRLNIDIYKIKAITVYDIMGRKIKSFSGQTTYQNLDISKFSAGKYFAQLLLTDGQMYNTQFVKVE